MQTHHQSLLLLTAIATLGCDSATPPPRTISDSELYDLRQRIRSDLNGRTVRVYPYLWVFQEDEPTTITDLQVDITSDGRISVRAHIDARKPTGLWLDGPIRLEYSSCNTPVKDWLLEQICPMIGLNVLNELK